MDSILTSIKKSLGIMPEYEHFDDEIIMHINTTFMNLAQLGVGPSEGFTIKDSDAVWSDFIPKSPCFEAVKSYTYLKVKLLFDSPTNAALIESMQRQIAELEWRISAAVDMGNSEEEANNE